MLKNASDRVMFMSRFFKKNLKLLTRVYSIRFFQHIKVVFFFE